LNFLIIVTAVLGVNCDLIHLPRAVDSCTAPALLIVHRPIEAGAPAAVPAALVVSDTNPNES
jgi:hypothetical protein